MVGILPTDFTPNSLDRRLQRSSRNDCLSADGHRPFILHDIDARVGNRLPSEEILSLRSISTLAHFIAPIAGPDAASHAIKLIQKFGSLSSALETAPDHRGLSDQEAEILSFLRSARALVEEAMHETMARSSFSTNSQSFLRYIKTHLSFVTRERILAVFVDAGGNYLRDEIIAEGAANAVRLPPRQIVRRALDLAAHGLLLAHNHPSGIARPSKSDFEATEKLREALSSCEIKLIDHFIVARNDIFSMRRGALI